MSENNRKLPKFESLDALTDFFDNNDVGDYLESMPEVAFDVEIKGRRHFVAVDEEIADKISEISRQEQVPSGAIVNSWLREKISDYSHKV